VAATALTCVFFFVLTRLRLPAAPVLAVFAAHALLEIPRRWRAGRHRPALAGLVAGVVVLVLVTSTSPLSAGRNPAWESSLVVESAKALDRGGHAERAEAAYRLARELDPGSVDAVLGLAEHAVGRRDLEGAVALYEVARDLAPDRFRIRNNLGILYFSTHRLRECEREMIEARRLDSGEATPYLYLGWVARATGDPTWSDLLTAALERDPRQPSAYVALLEGALAAGDPESAREWAMRARNAGVELPRELLARVP
jgi:Tfp pilus assembly protein PilF